MTQQKLSPIAVVGVSAIFPGSVDKTGFYNDLLRGTDQMREIPETHWLVDDYYDADPSRPDKTYAKRGAFIGDVQFDPMAWGIPPSIVPATDTAQLLALIVAKQVLEDAFRERFSTMDRERMSCILGVTSAQELLASMVSRLQRPVWVKALREEGVPEDEVQRICDRIVSNYSDWQESTFPGLLGNVVAGRIANRIGIGGTNCVTDAACASSFSALSMGVNELELGQSDVVICGGVDTMNDIFMYMCFSKTPALSASGDCRPFSDKADGTMLGEGFGMVALKRLADAERDGDRVYAVIRAVGSSSDGRAKSVYAPVAEGQAKALRRAYAVAGYGPETVELVEAHGTGTKAGDAAEFGGLRTVFDESGRADRQWCQIGSVKSQIGHTKAAAGAAGLVKAVLALHHKVLPPTIKVDTPNPKLELEKSPFHVTTRARPWARSSDHPRRASVSSFGFGGSNFHVVCEEYTGPKRAFRSRVAETELLLFTGADVAAVRADVEAAKKGAPSPGLVRFLASSTASRYDAGAPVRLAVVASDETLAAQLDKALEALAKGAPTVTPGGIALGMGASEGEVAFLFPGQGSQYVDMGASLAMTYDDAIAAWDLAAGLDFGADVRLPEVVFPKTTFTDEAKRADEGRLTATEWAQPGIGCASLALHRVLTRIGVAPKAVGGHSFGEVTALHAAGVLGAEEFLRVARRRGECMRDAASKPGAMTAVSAKAEVLRPLLAEWGIDVVLANHNAPEQAVLSGETSAIDAVEKKLGEAKIRFQRLKVATAFHSKVVAESTVPFSAFLGGVAFSPATVPVYANATASPYPADTAAMRAQIGQQIAEPVRFVEMVEAMYAAGIRTFVEVGPGSVLTGLVGRILKGRGHRAVSLDRSGRDAVTSLHHGLAELAAAGVPMRPGVLLEGFEPAHDPRLAEKPKLALAINGANYLKPYPPKGGSKALPKPNPPRSGGSAPRASGAPPATGGGSTGVAASAPRATASAAASVAVAITDSAPTPKAVAKPTNGHANGHGPTAPSTPVSAHPNPAAVSTAGTQRPSLPTKAMNPTGPHPSLSSAWLDAYQQTQLATAQAHAAYQKAMADTHAAFLRASETSILGLVGLATGQMPALAPAPQSETVAMRPIAAPVAFAPRAVVPASAAPIALTAPVAQAVPQPVHVPPAPVAAVAQPVPVSAPVAKSAAPPAPRAPVPAAKPVAAAPAVDLQRLMMDVVAEKTGYPAEMLGLGMDLEADLGVDSIKRVEILSSMREKAPSLPDVDAGEMAKLRTLGQIVEYMQGKGGAPATAATPAPSAAPVARPASGALDLEKLMMEVVAEKTGYPAEMLGLGMDLEADLGVDSIKRVEILSSMREKAPSLPDVDAGEMAKLRTLGQIVEYMRGRGGGDASPTASASPGAESALDLEKLMMEVVAEKTGYPAEMLGLGMDLEADLGVDSIKRVEILSSMREKAPSLPDVDAGEMAKLRTLGQIVEYMRGRSGAAPVGGNSLGKAPAPQRDARIGRHPLRLVSSPAKGFALRGLRGCARLCVTDDATGVASALVEALASRGLRAELVSEVPAGADGAIFLGGLREVADVDAAVAVNYEAFRAAKALAPALSKGPGVFVTVQDTGGDFGLSGSSRAWLGGLSGLAKTAAQEWPSAGVRALDVSARASDAATLAARIADELTGGGNELEVAYGDDGVRRTLESFTESALKAPSSVGPGSVVVASGGARGVTAECLVALAEATRCKVVLLGRTALEEEPTACKGAATDAELKRALLADAKARGASITPPQLGKAVATILANREVRRTIARIEAVAACRYVVADVQDEAAVRAALASVRSELGPITAIVHGAGVLADRFLVDKTEEQFRSVFETKVRGLRVLLSATADDPIDTLVFFSSVAARCGNQGQSDYAMANEVLNKVAAFERARRGGDVVVKSLGWGPWKGGMVTPQLEARFAALDVPLIPLHQGAAMMAEELTRARTDEVEIVIGGEPKPEALLAESAAPFLAEVTLSHATFPALDGHRVKGQVVVPVVLALELFARVLAAAEPRLVLGSIDGVKVLRGIVIEDFERGATVRVAATKQSNGVGAVYALELTSLDGKPHYRATARLLPAGERPVATARTPAHESSGGRDDVYGGVLFHGAPFRVIRRLDGVSSRGASATLVGGCTAGWVKGAFETDPALLDGGLQLALLFTEHALGGHSLPTSVESLRVYAPGLAEGTLAAELSAREAKGERAVSDIRFVEGSGRVVAELVGVTTHVLPGTRPG